MKVKTGLVLNLLFQAIGKMNELTENKMASERDPTQRWIGQADRPAPNSMLGWGRWSLPFMFIPLPLWRLQPPLGGPWICAC